MNTPGRMSPLTALFLGIFGVGAVGIASGTTVVLYGLKIIDHRADHLVGLADDLVGGAIENLPAWLEALPPSIKEMLNDRRAPEYVKEIDVQAMFISGEPNGGSRAVVTVTNRGEEVVTLLAVRVVALNQDGVPVREWTEVVATPLAIDGDWRGPLLPGAQRYAIMSASHGRLGPDGLLTPKVEIADVRVLASTPSEPRT